MFSSRLSLSALIDLCRVLRHYLHAGLALPDVFRQQAGRGSGSVRPVAERIARQLERGRGLEEALQGEAGHFPPLFISLACVGEQTGMLPEVFGELERFYLRVQELRRSFVARVAWPVVQFFLAILVLAGLIFVLGLLPSSRGFSGEPYDPLGLGLTGPSGAAIFLGVVFGTLLGVMVLYLVLTRAMRQRASVDRFLLGVPALGPCLRSLALARFSLALSLTTESGMPIRRALRLAFRATGNAAFAERSGLAESAVRGGEEVAEALSSAGLFPGEYVRVVAVGEESGRLSEVLRQQADHYHEEAGRRLAFLTAVAGYGVWLFVGVVIIVAIFRLFFSYLSLLDSVGV
jgi:type IV pilus assembly protein PilC